MQRATAIHLAFLALLVPGCSLCQAQPEWRELPPMKPAEAPTIDLVKDGGFENPEAKAWRFSDWPPRKATGDKLIANSVYYADSVVHSGEGALCVDLSTVGEDRILLAQQKLDVEDMAAYDGLRIRMSAWAWLADGLPGSAGTLTIRQWGEPGTPPLSYATVSVPARPGEWTQSATEFTLRMGETRRADIGIGVRQVPDLASSPIIYFDDIKLGALIEPHLGASLLCGKTIFAPDTVVPIKITVSEDTWQRGLRYLRWDVTTPDGGRSCRQGSQTLTDRVSVVEADTGQAPEGENAIRIALGGKLDERMYEVLLSFRKARGPHVR